jgi:pimeloyl-ACP methyl ester carboxylesterase
MLTERSYDTGQVVLNIAEGSTDGLPLLLLHGATQNWRTFEEFLPALERDWHVYAIDLRGHGKSGWVSSAYRVVDYVQDVVAVINHVIRSSVVVMGFSLGGTITFGVAAHLRDKVRAIVALDPGLMFREVGFEAATEPYTFLKWIAETVSTTHSLPELTAQCKKYNPALSDMAAEMLAMRLRTLDPSMLTSLLANEALEGFDFEQVFPQIKCPMYMVRGDPALGGVVRDSDVALVSRCIPQSTTAQIQNIGHSIIWGEPGQQTLAHLQRFLSSL